MSISSTVIYGANSTIITSDLYEDLEKLKTDVTILTTSHLSVATNHDGRLDVLEVSDASNITRIVELETDVSSNTIRIVTLETDNTSNINRLDTLELDNTDNKLRLDDAEGQIFNVVHEPNKYALEFFYGFYPVPYAVLEAYNQLFYSKTLTLKNEFDASTTTDIKDVIKVIQEILQTHEMKIVNIEFFNTLSEAKAAAQFLLAGGKYLNNKFGKKIIKKFHMHYFHLVSLKDFLNNFYNIFYVSFGFNKLVL